ncbi:ABC transporter permease [Hutsoniella sourekii]|uniref:ABC transporter permease n=1 Tax=Hutsoniella sourekii TaxID=87650 RepID=UPI000480F61B|nr:ABC transporter permease [Hutsoniella sourekii]
MKKSLYTALSLILLLLIWQVAVTLLQVPDYILPGPGQVGQTLLANDASFYQHVWTTCLEAIIGLTIACLTAFITALVMDRFQPINHLLYPLLVVSQTIPTMVLAPLLSLWFGFEMTPKIILVVLSSYFPIVIGFVDRMKQVSSDQVSFLATLGATNWHIYRLLKIPYGMVGFFSGLKIASSYCVGGAIIGEWISAESGLGYYMIRAQNSFATDRVFASIVWVIILSLTFNTVARCLEYLYYQLLKGSH